MMRSVNPSQGIYTSEKQKQNQKYYRYKNFYVNINTYINVK